MPGWDTTYTTFGVKIPPFFAILGGSFFKKTNVDMIDQ
jgi:hypothetical protein